MNSVVKWSVAVFVIGMLFPNLVLSSQVTAHDNEASNSTETTKHVVLIHGSFHGAWCWYKISTRLQRRGYTVAAIDLTSQGRDKTIADNVTSIAQYVKPVSDYLENTTGKVVLVGHSLGGISVSYLMEKFGPEKIAKAMFIASPMPKDNQSFVEASISGVSVAPNGSQPLTYANGFSSPPTSVNINLDYARQLFYNESPEEDITLAKTLLSATPFSVTLEYLHLTPGRYGRIPRYYIITLNDGLVPVSLMEAITEMNPPDIIFRLSGSDHSPFFSQPSKLTQTIQFVDSL